MNGRMARWLLNSGAVTLTETDPDVYAVMLHGTMLGNVAKLGHFWSYARPLPSGDGVTIEGDYRNRNTAVRRLLRSY